MKLLFIEDAGHGWLRVPVAELIELGLVQAISAFSYISPSRKWAYLEEDCDVERYLVAKGWGKDEWANNIKRQHSTRSAVRGYDSFKRYVL